MAEENNVHVKVAMAEVFGLVLIGFIAILVGLFGLGSYDDLSVISGVAVTVGTLLIICTIIAFLNENILLTAIFGVMGLFLLAFKAIAVGGITEDPFSAGMVAIAFVGVVLLICALVSLVQPVKMLPILLFVAGLAFIFLAIWWGDVYDNGIDNDYRTLVGVFWTLASIISLYMAAAISLLVMKGKPVLPLLIKA
ncbi:MAG: hypothetical protein WC375_06890 [Methanomassiliicoccales archaeon]|jgi:uncharacterized membrane protein HdeD (DUF308 family)